MNLKHACRKYGVSIVAMLSLLGISATVQNGHVHADTIGKSATRTVSAGVSQQDQSAGSATVGSQATDANGSGMVLFDDDVFPDHQTNSNHGPVSASVSASVGQSASVSQDPNRNLHIIWNRAYLASLNRQSKAALLERPAGNGSQESVSSSSTGQSQSAMSTVSSVASQKISASSALAQSVTKQSQSQQAGVKLASASQPKAPLATYQTAVKHDDMKAMSASTVNNSFQQFIRDVEKYVGHRVQGRSQDIREAEQEAYQDANRELARYKAQKDAKYEQQHHVNANIADQYGQNVSNRLLRKFKHAYNLAKDQLGKPYAWGGNGPSSFDCSGLVRYVYYYGLHRNLPRTAAAQYMDSEHIPFSKARIGDLVFFGSSAYNISHVGIYLGHDLMVDAQLRGVIVEHVHAPWWHLVGVGRVVK